MNEGLKTSSMASPTSQHTSKEPGSFGRGWRSSILWCKTFNMYNVHICSFSELLIVIQRKKVWFWYWSRWPAWKRPRISQTVLHQKGKPGRSFSRCTTLLVFITFLFYGTIFVRYDAVYSFHQIHYCTKVDCGNKRAGVRSEDAQAVKIVEFIHQHPK